MDKGRTSGDGMEQEEIQPKVEENLKTADVSKSTLHSGRVVRRKDSAPIQENIHAGKTSIAVTPLVQPLYRQSISRSLAPVIPQGELVPMRPRLINSTTTTTADYQQKIKTPKFIPYEPYPGAVSSIMAGSGSKAVKVNKNNLDIGVLVSQMTTMRTQELNDGEEEVKSSTTECSANELQTLHNELKKLKEERDHFHSQYKFQMQVNTELKNLLIASVGEDLQTRVNVLTEDKLQLARALLDTANNLTTHAEQIEFLAGQCEVWRSKFLASSVMVEELARWKADLTQKNEMLNESSKRLLHSTHQIREIQLETLKNLKFLAKIRYLNLPSSDVVSLSAENLNITQQMVLHSGVGMPESNLNISSASSNPLCESEVYAVQALKFTSQTLMATDEAVRALFEQAKRPYGHTIEQSTCKSGEAE